MSELILNCDPISIAIDSAMVAENKKELPRPYVGMNAENIQK